jgi:hypothetical protein
VAGGVGWGAWTKGEGEPSRDVTAETSLAAALSVWPVRCLFSSRFPPHPRADDDAVVGARHVPRRRPATRRCVPCGANRWGGVAVVGAPLVTRPAFKGRLVRGDSKKAPRELHTGRRGTEEHEPRSDRWCGPAAFGPIR